MRILSLKAENMLSFKSLYLEFGDNGLVLVDGWNYDNNRSNGAGKTAIFNLLSLAIYEKMPRKVNTSEFLKYGEKRGFVEVRIQTSSEEISATYRRPKKRIIKNSNSQDISQSELENLIGLSYEQFLISMYTAQKGGNKFLDLNDSRKKEFLLDLMNLQYFTQCRQKTDEYVKKINRDIEDANTKIEKARSKIDAYSDNLANEDELLSQLDEINSEISELNEQITKLQKVPEPDLSKIRELEAKIRDKEKNFASLRSKREHLHEQYKNVSNKITDFEPSDPDAYCPSCDVPLKVVNGTVASFDDQEALRKQHEQHVQELRNQANNLKEQINSIDEQLKEEKKVRDLENQVKEKREKESAEYNNAVKKIRELQRVLSNKQQSAQNIQYQIDQSKDVRQKIETLNQSIEERNKLINQYHDEKDIYETISQMFSPTGAQAYLMDSVIDLFNESVNKYISYVWPSATYQLKTYRENSTGEVTSKFSETLVINGWQRSIGALSGGEERAFSLAIDFAIIDVLGQQFGMSLNPIIMDEPFEGLDAVGRETVVELLEELSVDRQIWIIDHASELKTKFSQIFKVEKRNDTSEISAS